MYLLDAARLTVPEQLAVDDLLLEDAEAGQAPGKVLRLWEADTAAIVAGRSSHLEHEVRWSACHEDGVPIFRRSSGGAAVLIGPGCLMYSLLWPYADCPELRALDLTHRFVLGRLLGGLRPLLPEPGQLTHQGTSDLAWRGRKVSGNSLRCKREHFLYHGTLLYDVPGEQIDRYLAMPPRVPDYRAGRDHRQFVTNLPLGADELRQALLDAWQANEPCAGPELPRVQARAARCQAHAWIWEGRLPRE